MRPWGILVVLRERGCFSTLSCTMTRRSSAQNNEQMNYDTNVDWVLRSSVNQVVNTEGRHLIRLAILLGSDDLKVNRGLADQWTARAAKRVSETLNVLRRRL